jgi:DNA-binding NarL/FixJ family response regulator
MAAEARAQRTTTRVVIVDDHILYRELVTSVVNSIGGLHVVGWAANETEALRLCWRERPGLIVLDLKLPSGDGLGTLERLRSACPAARFLIFSGNLNPHTVRRALANGPHSLVGKGATLEEFRQALLAVAAGRTYYSPETAAMIRSIVVSRTQAGPAGEPRLSAREEAVLSCLAQGLTTRETAEELGLSRHTVANHLSRLRRKTGLKRTAQLSLYAAQQGLLDLPPRPPAAFPS